MFFSLRSVRYRERGVSGTASGEPDPSSALAGQQVVCPPQWPTQRGLTTLHQTAAEACRPADAQQHALWEAAVLSHWCVMASLITSHGASCGRQWQQTWLQWCHLITSSSPQRTDDVFSTNSAKKNVKTDMVMMWSAELTAAHHQNKSL